MTRATQDVVEDAAAQLHAEGVAALAATIPVATCAEVLAAVRASRAFGPELFLSEASFHADPQRFGVNPRPGRNLLERVSVDRIAGDAALRALLERMLGPGYGCRMQKVVCAVPATWLPGWVKAEIDRAPNTNLGAYVRPEHRDLTYFHGIDFHQDIIDYKSERADKLTVYVYLDTVTPEDSPVFVLPGSHRLGVTVFPHDLTRVPGTDAWRYAGEEGRVHEATQQMLTGAAGAIYVWHACLLHGTRPPAGDRARLSLRFVFEKAPGAAGEIDAINARLEGPASAATTEAYRDAAGVTVVRKNHVNEG